MKLFLREPLKRLARIRPWLQGYLETGKLPGATILVARHGKVVFCESEGLRNLEDSKTMTSDTILRFYSMTKPITSVALMMLYEEGLFQLDDPVSERISRLTAMTRWSSLWTGATPISHTS